MQKAYWRIQSCQAISSGNYFTLQTQLLTPDITSYDVKKLCVLWTRFYVLQPLDEATKKELETALKAFLKKGETLLLTTSVNPELMGGMVVSIGDKYVDMSIASKVKRYTDLLNVAV